MRQRTIKIRVSEAELEAFRDKAQAAGLTLSELLRVAASGAPIPSRKHTQADAHLLVQLLGQLGRIGNNLNQLAKAANAGKVPVPLEHVKTRLDELNELRLLLRRQLE